ncbi:MAG: OsmC family protein [Candidatus Bathyarchaeia archaeon]|jgi:putative redox protein
MTGNQVSAEIHHSAGLKFNVELDGRRIQLDASKDMGQAFTPMELFLVALAGCTAMDVQWIMDKERQKLNRFDIAINGTRREEDPKYYDSITMRYSLTGDNIRKDAVERAIRLSQEEYCSVRAMIKDSVKLNITYTITNGNEPEQEYTLAPA